MAAAQTAEPRHALRAVSLFGVLAVAKATTLVGLGAATDDWSAWWPFAYFWQDALVALVFYAADATLRRPRLAWSAYVIIALYAAVNVPVTLVLSSPLTRAMLRAARGALADSVGYYLTVPNLAAAAATLVAALLLPLALTRFASGNQRRFTPILAVLALIAAVGPVVDGRIDTRGLHRNAVGALAATSMPRSPSSRTVRADTTSVDWRESPFERGSGEDLTTLRGAARGRNVVLVMLESTAARYLGLHGARPDPMPGLTRLAANALVVDRAYAVYPESIKGLFATLCSRYPGFDTSPDIYASVPCASLAGRLQSSGYATALFHSGRFDYLGMRATLDGRGFDTLEDAGAIGGDVQSSFGVDDASTVERMLTWIDARGAQPFFVTYLPISGHHPYAATIPGPFDGEGDFDRYRNALHESDAALARLVAGLERRGLDRRTLFVIAGDHGEAFNQHPGNIAHTLYAFEENLRVPYVIAAPGLFDGATRISRLVSAVDTAPTILDLLGLDVPGDYQGSSLLAPRRLMALFYTDYSRGWLGLADGCWKYLWEVEPARSTLYDVCRDPDETRDLAAAHPDRVAAYRLRVESWAAAQKAAVEGR